MKVDQLLNLIHRDEYLDSVAVAAADLDSPERRKQMADALRKRQARLVAPRIYALTHPIGQMMVAQYGFAPEVDNPAPHLVAAALCRQHGWQIAMPPKFGKYMLGLGDRPERLPIIPYNQPIVRSYPSVGLTLEPTPAALFDLTPAGQALVQGLPRESSEPGLLEIATQAACGMMGESIFRDGLREDLSGGRLGERERLVAEAILQVDEKPQAPRRAPVTFEPPKNAVKIDGWWVVANDDGDEFLGACRVVDHPYIDDGARSFRSSTLVWLDEKIGWARTRSRYYRLGRTREEFRRDEQPKRTLDDLEAEIRAVARGERKAPPPKGGRDD